ncbi:MAG TPA: hypothetical protein VGE47_06510 [Burkholderiaceae bacterium]
MKIQVGSDSRWRWSTVVWGSAGLLLLLPLVAMQFSREVIWTGFDFLVFGGLLFCTCAFFELAARSRASNLYRAALSVALLGAFLLVWVNLAVGIIGSADEPANLLFGGVLLVGLIGAAIERLRPQGMALVLLAMALAQVLVSALAISAGWQHPLIAMVFFVGMWLLSALLFWKAAQEQGA